MANGRNFDPRPPELVAGRLESPELQRLSNNSPPVHSQLPSIATLRAMERAGDFAGLEATMQNYGVLDSVELQRAQASAYVARMTGLPPGSPQFTAELSRTTRSLGQFSMANTAKQVAQQWGTLQATGGDRTKEMIWVDEGDDDTCDNCDAMGGTVRTLGEWEASGEAPGPSVCLGGSRCRCDLILIV